MVSSMCNRRFAIMCLNDVTVIVDQQHCSAELGILLHKLKQFHARTLYNLLSAHMSAVALRQCI
jgi:hypothetical protein